MSYFKGFVYAASKLNKEHPLVISELSSLEQAIAKNTENAKKKDIRSRTRTKFSVKEKANEIWKPDGDIAKE